MRCVIASGLLGLAGACAGAAPAGSSSSQEPSCRADPDGLSGTYIVDYRFPSGTESQYSTYTIGNPDAVRELFFLGMDGALDGSGLELPEAQGQAPQLQIMPLINSGGHDHWSMDCAVYAVQDNTLSVLFVYRQPYPYTDQDRMITDLGAQIGTFLRAGWACTGPDYFGAGGTASAL